MTTKFKTPKGTELPLINLKGKDYLQVAHRLVWFREEHPDWSIQTEFVEISTEKRYAIVKAMILSPCYVATFHTGAKGKVGEVTDVPVSTQNGDYHIIATAHKMETATGFADYLEKAETGAVGRALALCGYGTQFAPEIEEGERIVDSPTSPTTPVAHTSQPPMSPTSPTLPADGQTTEVELFIKTSEHATSKSGKDYWRVETDLGPMSSFVDLAPGDSYWVLVKGSMYNGSMSYAITNHLA